MDNKSLQIRNARPEELEKIALMLKAAYGQYRGSLPADVWEHYLEDIMNVRGRYSGSQLIVAEMDERLAGSVTMYLPDHPLQREGWPAGWAGIRLLAVHPDYRNKGIGRALMEECLRRCRKAGIKTVGLHTTEMMAVARRMYEKMGFTRVPKFDYYPRPGVVVMAYRLDLQVPVPETAN